jgi:SAM-dependent methyltransferase
MKGIACMSYVAKLAEPADVVTCYRLFLRREPENEDAVELHLGDRPTIWELIHRFAGSRENEPIRIDEGCSAIWRRQDGRDIRVDAPPAARAQILDHIEKIWSAYGTQDPYYSVLTNPAYRADNITSALTEEFYASGANGVANMRLSFERNRIDIDPHWHVLELGCGVGRIAEHFCQDFEYYYGVDISANHVGLATTRFSNKNIHNGEFLLLKEALDNHIDFDLFYSVIVLQHNPPPIIYHLLDRFLSKLKPGGFAFFQLPCHLHGYRFDSEAYLAGEGKHESMEMHALPQKYVFELLYKHSVRPIEVCPFSAIGPIGISYIFLARKSGAGWS